MKIIITGGSGLIGQALTTNLTKDGHTVFILSRKPNQVTGLPAGASVQGWDAESAAGWGHLVNETDALINLAGAGVADGHWSDHRKQTLRASRVNAAKAVVEALTAAESPPKVVIQASAVGFYGPHPEQTFNEGSAPGDDFLATLCQEWEQSAAAIAAMNIRLITIRTGIVLSTAGGALPKMVLPFKVFAGSAIGSGQQWMSWIHEDDEVQAIRFLIENQVASGPYNLTAPNPVTNGEMSRLIGKVMKRPVLMPVPSFVFKLLFSEMSTVLLDGQRVLPNALQDAGFKFRHPDAEAALRDLLG